MEVEHFRADTAINPALPCIIGKVRLHPQIRGEKDSNNDYFSHLTSILCCYYMFG